MITHGTSSKVNTMASSTYMYPKDNTCMYMYALQNYMRNKDTLCTFHLNPVTGSQPAYQSCVLHIGTRNHGSL